MAAILVTGGTGTLGRQVVPRVREAGQDVRVLSRSRREPAEGVEYVTGDLAGNEGIDAALDGIETVMHLAGGNKGDDVVARNLMGAVSRAHVKHLVLISVIGAAACRWPGSRPRWRWSGSWRSRACRTRSCGPRSSTTWCSRWCEGWRSPRWCRFRAGSASSRWTRATSRNGSWSWRSANPRAASPTWLSPKVFPIGTLIRGYLRASGKHRATMPVRIPGKAGRAYRAGDNLSIEGTARGTRTWEDFQAERLGLPTPAKAAAG
ncbi:SDR family oxidoreductase [Actinomadura luteofluorescens]|uniref:SDR family oxidoreductase n=1 Tax=Actinomadura luteofluorescens TaxID=46163 RepID=UPI00363E8BAD